MAGKGILRGPDPTYGRHGLSPCSHALEIYRCILGCSPLLFRSEDIAPFGDECNENCVLRNEMLARFLATASVVLVSAVRSRQVPAPEWRTPN
jgi:hypothetical protein